MGAGARSSSWPRRWELTWARAEQAETWRIGRSQPTVDKPDMPECSRAVHKAESPATASYLANLKLTRLRASTAGGLHWNSIRPRTQGEPRAQLLDGRRAGTRQEPARSHDHHLSAHRRGQEGLRRALTASLLAGGHVLVESVPGLAKTTAAQTLASAVSGTFHRIQCTPDLMPNDIVGSQIWNQERGEMVTHAGPVHANMVLLDEINRSSAKTQSAMLEAMQERQTTIGGVNHKLPNPFMVMATQNPIEEEGTYVLPRGADGPIPPQGGHHLPDARRGV